VVEAFRYEGNAVGIHVPIRRHSGNLGWQEAISVRAWHYAKNCVERNGYSKKPSSPVFDLSLSFVVSYMS
jgi:hypothetical protein